MIIKSRLKDSYCNYLKLMDPPGVFIVFGILHFYTDTDTDIVTGTVGTLLHWPGLDPGTSK